MLASSFTGAAARMGTMLSAALLFGTGTISGLDVVGERTVAGVELPVLPVLAVFVAVVLVLPGLFVGWTLACCSS